MFSALVFSLPRRWGSLKGVGVRVGTLGGGSGGLGKAFRIPAILALRGLIFSLIVIGSTSVLSPKPTRGVLGTPIPQASPGGTSQVYHPS
ncbi:hypothetical protein PISMIDRAFT_364700 [Pisolithus microcarpus 441]|uniref:Unplaced genomic scaffold scaffold_275, whole genome shotgun sequence n=1 Tax=Pisolithus microcarpus 441 TaxID=765257 RepID=A0A0C9YV65_9AGAM|nr:hypothetical protein PISMIDRAFT_364700 [Pisolithus microcarpus 441]